MSKTPQLILSPQKPILHKFRPVLHQNRPVITFFFFSVAKLLALLPTEIENYSFFFLNHKIMPL
ncbi:hypothetical protein C7N43_38565 [Sphingobacteriales bacterium UPWRP_1]|nr:hypothetical protein B6N25_08440 [Sphingobacteriales bacterium TSM_CSS]PSJ71590.1 hypothetical protein C7N43_38565 [Sphingobacteriales bacterium UPWRP_1]